ncbi:MAG TPA: hypothetical protein VGG28_32215 [Kofleriaceae bacterium]|jgi:hypothetical protein
MPAKRCPMCHRASEDRAWQCACGYEFGQPVERTLELLRGQSRTTKIMLGIFLVLDAGAVIAIVEATLHGFVVFSGLGFAALVLGTLRQIRKLAIGRESTRLLSAKLLPIARVIQKPKPGSDSDGIG